MPTLTSVSLSSHWFIRKFSVCAEKKKKLPTVVVLRYEKGQTEALFMVGREGRQHAAGSRCHADSTYLTAQPQKVLW